MPTLNSLTTLVLLTALISSSAVAQSPVDLFQQKTVQVGSESLEYGLFVPSDLTALDTYPVIIALAGSGAAGNDEHLIGPTAATWVTEDSQNANPAFVLAPAYPQNFDPNTYFPELATPGLQAVLGEMSSEYPIDLNRLYVTGLSVGAMAAWAYMYTDSWGGWFAAALLMSGQWVIPDAPTVDNTPVWAFCGTGDGLLPDVRDMIQTIEDAGYQVMKFYPAWPDVGPTIEEIDQFNAGGRRQLYTEIPGWGHGPWRQLYDNPAVHYWLFSQARSGIRRERPGLRSDFELTLYPNPATRSATLQFRMPVASTVTMEVFDVLGRNVAEPVRSLRTPGLQRINLDGGGLAEGVYVVRLTTQGWVQSRTLVIAQ